jgi:TolC family type I secretion outer membrane protein
MRGDLGVLSVHKLHGFSPLLLGFLMVASLPAQAQSLGELIPELLETHNLIKASQADLEAASQNVKSSQGAWFPQLDLTAHYGFEAQNKPAESGDTDLATRKADLSVTQLLWDFGKTNADIRANKLTRSASRFALKAQTQDILLIAIESYLTVRLKAEVLMFALQSEANMKRQNEIEDALVERGAGLSTDVLDSKQKLAGAQSKRSAAAGELKTARNAYRRVFQTDVKEPGALEKPNLPIDLLPASVEEAINTALRENPRLKSASATSRVNRETANAQRATGFFPVINMVGEAIVKKDAGGTVGNQQELLGKVEMNFPFNLGFTAINTLKAAKGAATAGERRVSDARDQLELDVRDAWDNLETAREKLEFDRNQANLSAEFLELARRERQLGNRTLNDILDAETELIDANSRTATAETDVAIGVYKLIQKMGRLEADVLTRSWF